MFYLRWVGFGQREGLVREKVLPIATLPRSAHVYLVNSVRGQEEVLVDTQKGGPP